MLSVVRAELYDDRSHLCLGQGIGKVEAAPVGNGIIDLLRLGLGLGLGLGVRG